ncbi:MAG: ketopantoate reductase family protein [Bacillota bacterium]|jgi:2-dehydropantoate 2-reductase|nr:ketopantoate reductase family protein [Bacillota bacterium]MDP4155132.1 ketopantoate reductase family protein [Bacillota bacterium]
MKILVIGAGAVGGYFGGRLLEKGEDVTYLVREGRQKQLQDLGLDIESIHGNVLLHPKTILAGEEAGPFDVILMTTKSYHLDGAIKDLRPYITEETVILPLLNGISHFETLDKELGAGKVIGGLCFIESTLDSKGRIIQTSPSHDFVFGERNGEKTERIMKIADAFSGTKANFRLSENINQDLWHKYMFISTMSGITTLMRQPIGPIRETETGLHTIKRLQSEIFKIMKSVDAPIADEIESMQMKQIAGLGYTMKSSMQRDMEKLAQVEVEHLHGYLLGVAQREKIDVPVLKAVYANLKIYQQQL